MYDDQIVQILDRASIVHTLVVPSPLSHMDIFEVGEISKSLLGMWPLRISSLYPQKSQDQLYSGLDHVPKLVNSIGSVHKVQLPDVSSGSGQLTEAAVLTSTPTECWSSKIKFLPAWIYALEDVVLIMTSWDYFRPARYQMKQRDRYTDQQRLQNGIWKCRWRVYSGWCLHNTRVGLSVASDMDFFSLQSFILLCLQAEFLERQIATNEYSCSMHRYLPNGSKTKICWWLGGLCTLIS
jgi:hypothetical protein